LKEANKHSKQFHTVYEAFKKKIVSMSTKIYWDMHAKELKEVRRLMI
jgi:hypothetical protein